MAIDESETNNDDTLLPKSSTKPAKTPTQHAVRKTFKASAHLANLLPTGSVLTFQVLSPVITRQGKCISLTNQIFTAALLGICAASCFLLCLSDSFRDRGGKVRHGFATLRGIWVIDSPDGGLSPEEAYKYRLRFVDLFHALLAIMVFAGVALFDQNVVKCFCPEPSDETRKMLSKLPIGIAVVCSLLVVVFPSKRHGIGFPLSRR
ncbi:protein DMP7-like [Impatiens glandulifera]|uniref:protein DMP7-like n=1 Tax=Impatiens glandulifera TaxID=253017 RepID=UPI001FB19C83|nr:protein DMP7-like [Impatiens glandulifera]